jgi:hypothetical protein
VALNSALRFRVSYFPLMNLRVRAALMRSPLCRIVFGSSPLMQLGGNCRAHPEVYKPVLLDDEDVEEDIPSARGENESLEKAEPVVDVEESVGVKEQLSSVKESGKKETSEKEKEKKKKKKKKAAAAAETD